MTRLVTLLALLVPASARAQICFRARPGPACRCGYRSLAAVDVSFDAHRRNLTGRTSDVYLGFRLGALPGVAFGVVTPIVLIVLVLGSGPD